MSNQQVAIREQIDSVRAILEKMKPQMALALPKHLTPERLLRVTMTAVQNVPRLLECDRTSLFAAVMTSAQLGLEPDGVLGQAYLVPFAGKVQFIPGYKGLITLARNSGELSSIQSHEVCKGDEFTYAYGLKEELHHVAIAEDRSWGNVTHFYAYATFKDGGHVFEVLTRAQVEAIRNNSQGYKAFAAGQIKTNPWDPKQPSSIQMGRKTLIRRIANYLPLSVQRAAAIDAAYESGKHASTDEYGDIVITGEATDVTPETPATTTTQSKLDQLAGPAPTAPTAAAEPSKKGGKKAKGETSEAPTPPQSEPTAAPAAGASDPQGGPVITPGVLTAAIIRATTVEQIDEQLDLARGLPENHQASVQQAAEARKRQLSV